ncbi:Response regulator receiver domain-containing protein [Pseudobutyrivibrio sp. YE44]|uniref:response regulator n=1 Tax=Pseudobutyrivibrio sp. YE44 TaxID=1520802 RepID=UPI00088A12B7|nr:response regulator [Pseudobutyrivibrio sp. YE44]SDB13424.1 Response regulator receiver domain-containing protein [Pseudobutyrivibrio sp. YE44]
MGSNSVMIICHKETFIIRVLLKKLADAEISAFCVSPNINLIEEKWSDAGLITFYLENDENLHEDLLRYAVDKLRDNNKQAVLIGEAAETDELKRHIAPELIYKVLPRPLDYDNYISTVNEYYNKAASDELKKSILVVDDDPSFMGVVREWLKDDYKVSMANSGLRAIKWLASNKVDLILLDYEMPVTDGPQVLEMLRADDETKDTPVIFLTGKDDKESVMSVVSLKPQGYVLKSAGKDELMGKVKMFFTSRI